MNKQRKASAARARRRTDGRFRIIGGEWRSRRLPVPDAAEVRPTPDRVRETVFNWLAPVLQGARCLDLYAGSGALGLEALSRGAARVVFVDRAPRVCAQLRSNLELLGCARAEVLCMDAMSCLEGRASPYDLVFLDPPYGKGLLEPLLSRLAAQPWLAAGGRVYLEQEAGAPLPPLPAGWTLARSARAGQVSYHLATPGAAEKGDD